MNPLGLIAWGFFSMQNNFIEILDRHQLLNNFSLLYYL